MSITVHDATRDEAPPAAPCAACDREAWFEARVDARVGAEPVGRQAHACASHLLEIVQGLSAWVRDNDLAGGMLTVLAPHYGTELCTIAIMRPGRPAGSARAASGGQGSRCA
jgi:hypothetical protein